MNTTAPKVIVVIPAYRVCRHILEVIAAIGPEVSSVLVVEDGCPEMTGNFVAEHCADPRIRVLRHERNKGVGAAVVSGYREALKSGADIIVKLDGDGQMDPRQIPRFIEPLVRGEADYCKGNRFYALSSVARMPLFRLCANAAASVFSKASSGYWALMDPANGFTAVRAEVLRRLPLDQLDEGYFFESDMLFQLGLRRAVVRDIPVSASYGDGVSNVAIIQESVRFPLKYTSRLLRRLGHQYFPREESR